MITCCWLRYSFSCHAVYRIVHPSRLTTIRTSSISSTSQYTINICTECVLREIRLFSRFFPYSTRSSRLYFYVFVLGRTVPFGHSPRLYVTVCSMCNQWEISRCSSSAPAFTSVPSFVSIPSCPPPPPSPGSSRLLSSPREHHGYIYGGVVRGQGQQEPPLSLLQPPRQSRRERATAAASPPPPSPPSSRDAPRAPPAPSSPPPRREATLRRAAAAEQQRGLQHTGTAAQQDEGVEETEAQDGPRWATPPTFLFTCFFLLFLLLFLIFFSTVLHPFFTFSTRFNMRTLFASVRLLGALYRHVALRDFFKFRGLSTILFRRFFRNVGFAMLTGLNRDNFLIFFF